MDADCVDVRAVPARKETEMTEKPTCRTCRFFEYHEGCKRHAPVFAENRLRREWPSVSWDDWCGDHEPATFDKEGA